MVPENKENPYLDELCRSLADNGVVARQLSMGPTSSQTLNTVLVLPRLAWQRLRGARVLHLHWTYPFSWRWADRLPIARHLPRWWFEVLLRSARAIGFRLVYTSHNLLPHTPVFDDDRAARASLLRQSNAVITFSRAAAERMEQEFGVTSEVVSIIPEGTPRSAATSDRVHTHTPLAVSFGHLESYKGVDLFIEAASSTDTLIDVELLGSAGDERYAAALGDELERLRRRGRRGTWHARGFRDDELEELLKRATMAVFPFREITNSTSMRVAMAHDVPCILPALPSFADVPRESACWFEPGDIASLAHAMDAVATADARTCSAMTTAARAWLAEWDWTRVGRATRLVYERALR